MGAHNGEAGQRRAAPRPRDERAVVRDVVELDERGGEHAEREEDGADDLGDERARDEPERTAGDARAVSEGPRRRGAGREARTRVDATGARTNGADAGVDEVDGGQLDDRLVDPERRAAGTGE